jgi:polyhydroxyalkanoate synthase subunit PhaC
MPHLPTVPRPPMPKPPIPRPRLASPADMLGRIRRDVERNALRARNGIKYVGGLDRPQVGQSAKDVVWARDKAQLWHYHRTGVPVGYTPPVLIVMSLVSRSYILDLAPDNSFIKELQKGGLDVYLLDWGVPDEADAENTLETYVDDYLPRAFRALLRDSGCEQVNVLGYCFGGILALLLAARHPELPIRALMTMATPVDFDHMGLFGHIFDHGVDPETLIDATGNVAPDTIRTGFRVLKPTADLAQYATLWEKLWDDEYMAGYQAMGQWTRDHIPFPGAAFRQSAEMVRANSLQDGTLRLAGQPVSLATITCPLLNVVAERDHIVPIAAAEPVPALVGSDQAEELRLPVGHVGLVVGRSAAKVTIPYMIDWWQRHSDPA